MRRVMKFFLLAILVIAGGSCKKDLVLKDYGSVNDQVLWKSSADLDQAITSSINYFDATWGYGTIFYILMEDGATDYWVGGANAAGEFSNFTAWRTGYPDTFDWGVWPAVWNSIYYDNLVLDRMSRVPNLTDAQKAKYKGVVKCLRALNYYFLQNEFGGVPIVTTPNDTRTSIPQSSRDDVRKQIEADLLDAISLLPDKGDASLPNYSWPSKQAAIGLLARLYLNWDTRSDHWQKTSDVCDQITGASLVAPYSKLFDLSNKNNPEMIYSIKHDATYTTGVFLLNDYFARPWDMYLPNTAQYAWGDWTVTDAFYKSFNPNDARRTQVSYTYKTQSGGTGTSTYPVVTKYPLDPKTNGWAGSNDLPVVRYADILLMKAEAQNELGNTNAAVQLVNQIRTRAGLGAVSTADASSQANMRTHIYNERRWEFFEEGLGRTDMIRNKTFIPWVQSKGVSDGTNYVVYPFSTGALQNNQGLKQNTGYLN